MPDGQVLEFSGVTKRFASVTAVSDFTARVEPGLVTGFLGPNGAGKTTSLRILLGLVQATEGRASIGGATYRSLRHPLQTVGAVLEATSFHPARTAANHLSVYARAGGVALSRVDDVLALVGLSDAAGRKVGGFSLGMRQRLGLATALLGDPGVLVLDEPTNGLDPEGIRWMRGLLRTLAAEGRTVLVSSHLLAEVQQTVDALVIIAGGRLVFSGGIEDLADPSDYATIVDAPDRDALVRALDAAGLPYEVLRNGLTVRTAEPAEVGALAASAGIALSSLQRRGAGLEDVFLELVSGARVHPSAGGAAAAAASAPEPDAAEPDATGPVASEPDASEPAASGGDDASGGPEAPMTPSAPDIPSPGDSDPASTGPQAGPPGETAEEPAPVTASFAVASTGVIDIIPADDSDAASVPARIIAEAPDGPEPEEAFDAQPQFEPVDDDAPAIESPHHDAAFDPHDAPQAQPEQPTAPAWHPGLASPPPPEFAEDATHPDDPDAVIAVEPGLPADSVDDAAPRDEEEQR